MVIVTSNVSQNTLIDWTRALLDIRSTTSEYELAEELRAHVRGRGARERQFPVHGSELRFSGPPAL
jgi:hypothetical protein